ncbi:hypothetical protein F511_43053 [Dorcoceras hygrometricum]|uniref:Uncharacterized protein n=1 Tax=Dorcoceras hygrometricum TaxID=472368 RepID=A0A2Z7BYL6_9LAMI|nr:hypothetical protein F511_43053 [Dorcoceras hygrometricum]
MQALATRTELNSNRNAHPKAHASRRTHAQTFLKSFELQQLRVSTSSAIQLLKWVANERAKQFLKSTAAHTTEKRPETTPVVTIPEASSLKMGPTKEAGPGRVPPLDFFEDSLVVFTSGAMATRFLCHIAPDWDIGRLSGASNIEAVSLFSSNLALGGEVIKCLTQAQRETNDLHRHFDDTTEHCTQLEMWLAEVEAARVEEERVAEARRADLETQRLRLEAERAALMAEKRALAVDKETLEAEKTAMSEAINAWDLGKEEFLKSSEFDTLCGKKALSYFKVGFEGCVVQFQANGYSEEEHPAPLLDVKKALMEMSDEDEEAEEEDEEDDASGDEATHPSSPNNNCILMDLDNRSRSEF